MHYELFQNDVLLYMGLSLCPKAGVEAGEMNIGDI
jgi:hypothetical protein